MGTVSEVTGRKKTRASTKFKKFGCRPPFPPLWNKPRRRGRVLTRPVINAPRVGAQYLKTSVGGGEQVARESERRRRADERGKEKKSETWRTLHGADDEGGLQCIFSRAGCDDRRFSNLQNWVSSSPPATSLSRCGVMVRLLTQPTSFDPCTVTLVVPGGCQGCKRATPQHGSGYTVRGFIVGLQWAREPMMYNEVRGGY